MAVRVCSPLHIEAVTQTERGQFGRMLRFRDAIGNWHKWIMPMALLSGSCEELRGVLLTAGVEIEHRHRNLLPDYIQSLIPQKVINVATRTGWTDGCKAFVLPDQVIGDADVHFNGETCGSIGVSLVGGSFNQWQNMAQKG